MTSVLVLFTSCSSVSSYVCLQPFLISATLFRSSIEEVFVNITVILPSQVTQRLLLSFSLFFAVGDIFKNQFSSLSLLTI